MIEKPRVLGLDVGEKRIGMAISDPMGWSAQPIETLHRTKLEKDLDQIQKWVDHYKAKKIVVCLPKNMNGTVGPQGEDTKEFAELLKNHLNSEIEFIFWDERLSSRSAERILIEGNVSRKNRKGLIDTVAAVIILQNYMDAQPKG